MACVCPIEGWRARKCNDNGKYGLTFRAQDADLEEPLSVPCGKCLGCRVDQSREWGIRCFHESLLYERNAFLTLTYAEPPVDFSKYDLVCFFKRMRYAGFQFRYFGCGEYGSLSGRAHYHALIFGEDFRDGAYQIDSTLYGNPIVDYEWRHGLVSIGSVSAESCFYTAGYCAKKVDQDAFNVMSRKPGIGRRYLDRFGADMLATGTCVVGSAQYPVPRRYFEWADLATVSDRRKEFVRTLSPDDRWQMRVQKRAIETTLQSKQRLKQERI